MFVFVNPRCSATVLSVKRVCFVTSFSILTQLCDMAFETYADMAAHTSEISPEEETDRHLDLYAGYWKEEETDLVLNVASDFSWCEDVQSEISGDVASVDISCSSPLMGIRIDWDETEERNQVESMAHGYVRNKGIADWLLRKRDKRRRFRGAIEAINDALYDKYSTAKLGAYNILKIIDGSNAALPKVEVYCGDTWCVQVASSLEGNANRNDDERMDMVTKIAHGALNVLESQAGVSLEVARNDLATARKLGEVNLMPSKGPDSFHSVANDKNLFVSAATIFDGSLVDVERATFRLEVAELEELTQSLNALLIEMKSALAMAQSSEDEINLYMDDISVCGIDISFIVINGWGDAGRG